MPELPEIETIRLQLKKVLIGQKLVKSNFKEINNKVVKGIDRKGKMLLINFGSGFDLGFHFKMTGQLVYDDGKTRIAGGHPSEDFVVKLPNKHTREVFEFTDSFQYLTPNPSPKLGEGHRNFLYFNDQRKFGWVKINPDFGEKLGPEPFDINSDEFILRIQVSKNPIKITIMNQEKIAGVGNIYANDACWEAGINPQTSSHKLQNVQLELLFEKLNLVLREGIKYGGATAANYVDLHGLGGHYQDHFRVYKREGEKCLRNDGGIIKKITLGGRGTYFCPVCQKLEL